MPPSSSPPMSPLSPSSPSTPVSDDDDGGIVRCACGYAEDLPNQPMVHCDPCGTWQHIGHTRYTLAEAESLPHYECLMCELGEEAATAFVHAKLGPADWEAIAAARLRTATATPRVSSPTAAVTLDIPQQQQQSDSSQSPPAPAPVAQPQHQSSAANSTDLEAMDVDVPAPMATPPASEEPGSHKVAVKLEQRSSPPPAKPASSSTVGKSRRAAAVVSLAKVKAEAGLTVDPVPSPRRTRSTPSPTPPPTSSPPPPQQSTLTPDPASSSDTGAMPAHPPPPPPVRAAAAAAAARGSGTSTPTSSSRRAGTHAATAAAKRAASQSAAAAKRAAAAARAAAATAAAAQEVSRHASDTPQPSSSSQSDTGESSWRYDPGTHAVGGRAPQSVYDIRSRVKLLKQVARDRIADMKAFVAVQERALVEAEGALDTRAIGTAAMATPVRGGSLVPTLTQSPSGSSEDDSLMLVDPPLRPSGGTKNRDGNDGTSSSSSSASAVAEVVAARDAVEGAQVALRELRAWLRQVKRYDASHRWMWTSTTTATTAATSSS